MTRELSESPRDRKRGVCMCVHARVLLQSIHSRTMAVVRASLRVALIPPATHQYGDSADAAEGDSDGLEEHRRRPYAIRVSAYTWLSHEGRDGPRGDVNLANEVIQLVRLCGREGGIGSGRQRSADGNGRR
jgi:hypothetical protein